MQNNLTWRRCTNCHQLTLVPVSANVCWQCGAPCPERGPGGYGEADAVDAAGVEAGFPVIFGRAAEPWTIAAGSPAELNLPAPGPRYGAISAADDARARRLLASVFPGDADV